jgi:hypothetical protein
MEKRVGIYRSLCNKITNDVRVYEEWAKTTKALGHAEETDRVVSLCFDRFAHFVLCVCTRHGFSDESAQRS